MQLMAGSMILVQLSFLILAFISKLQELSAVIVPQARRQQPHFCILLPDCCPGSGGSADGQSPPPLDPLLFWILLFSLLLPQAQIF